MHFIRNADDFEVSITEPRATALLDGAPGPIDAASDPSEDKVTYFLTPGAVLERTGLRFVVKGDQSVVSALTLRSTQEGVDYLNKNGFLTESELSRASSHADA